MKDYATVTHITSNENGKEELVLEVKLTLTEWVVYSLIHCTLNVPNTRKETYEMHGLVWVDKATGKTVDQETQFECFEAKGWVRANSRWWDKMVGDKA